MNEKHLKYCIVMPPYTQVQDQTYEFPIGIAYVSASLKQTGRNVIAYNLNYKSGSIQDNVKYIVQKYAPDVIATGGLTAHYCQLKKIIDAAREIKPDIIVLVGGGIITSSPVPAMEALETVDYGMIGEGEITICELAEAIEGKRDIHSVDGLIFKENNEWTLTSPRAEIMDLDSIPYPDYEGFEFGELLDKTPTDIFALGKDRFGFVSFGRSCPFNCTFCFHPSGTRYRRRSMKSVFCELDYLIEKFDMHNVYITDELFVSKIEDLREFCYEIKKRGIGFYISLRVNMVNREMLELLRDAGCIQITFGLESADNRILKSMNKHITVEQIDYALSLCNEVGITAQGGFIFGDEAETVETYSNTIRWWREHPQYTITTNLIVVYPGSILYQHACQRGIIKDEVQFIKDGCPVINITKMTDKEYREMVLSIGMLPQGRTDVLRDASIQYVGLGQVDYTARCPKCGTMNTWKRLDVFRLRRNIICDHCKYSMHIVVADSIKHNADAHFRLLQDHKIAIWPMVNVVEELFSAVPSIQGDNVFYIDSSDLKQGTKLHNKIIYSPAIIKEEKIDTIFLTTTSNFASEIIQAAKSFPSVKQIFLVGELFDPHFPEKIIKLNINNCSDKKGNLNH